MTKPNSNDPDQLKEPTAAYQTRSKPIANPSNYELDFHPQYITDDDGNKTAVMVPFKEWQGLINIPS